MFVKKVISGIGTAVLIVGGLGSVVLAVVLSGGHPPVPDNQPIAAGVIGFAGAASLIWGIIELRKH